MEKYRATFNFKSLTESIGFELKSLKESDITTFTAEFLGIFSDKDEHGNSLGKFKNPMLYDKEIINEVFDFIDHWQTEFPNINGLKSFFNKLNQGDLYFIVYNINLTPEISLYISTHLKAWKNDEDVNELWTENMEMFGKTFENYNMKIAGDFRLAIGNPVRKERVCRFCNRAMPEVSFNKRAHAISEALGNKHIIIYDECDSCNDYFGRLLEGDLITYLQLFRTIYGIKGKGGKKKIKGKNFEAFKDEDNKVNLVFNSLDERPKTGEEYNLKLHFEEKIINQNIYKTLCKFFLSVIDDDKLQYFEKTIKWIKGELDIDNLPLIGEAISYQTFRSHPEIVYFLRKSEDESLPYAICQFFFTCKTFLYIIPLSNKDSQDFNWNEVLKNLSHLEKFNQWGFNDFSSKKSKNFTIELNSGIETND